MSVLILPGAVTAGLAAIACHERAGAELVVPYAYSDHRITVVQTEESGAPERVGYVQLNLHRTTRSSVDLVHRLLQ